MKAFLILCLVALVSANLEIETALEKGVHPLSKEMVDLINRSGASWKAKHHFKEHEYEDVKNKMGTFLDHDLPDKYKDEPFSVEEDIPAEFDGRKQWPKCANIIGDIRDQANCGSCWAFAAVGAMSDRICVASNGEKQVKISSDDLLSCCTLWNSLSFCGFGCNGGIPILAWRYWVKRGIVSGGNFNETNTCRPYEIEPCGHHTKEGKQCDGNHRTPKCKRECVNGDNYKQNKFYGAKYYNVKHSVEAIQREIMAHGSVEAGFQVMSDFVQYESGVYESVGGGLLGGHAVRIIGWGTDEESKKPYWLIANSWNNKWGLDGYFKMVRGKNHCGIESQITAGLPKL